MTAKTDLIAQITAIVERAGSREGIEPVEVQFLGSGRNRLLRIYIDKEGGVTHTDCERVSQYVGTVLDVEDVIPGGAYTLEVSSPGVERKLTKPRDFERFIGQKVKLVLREPLEEPAGRQLYWEGVLAAFRDSVLTLEPGQGQAVQIPLDKVSRANLKFEW
jgi:ribosome maturation factor RimP